MNPVVVDVGNTRIKWGRCEAGRVVAMCGLPLHSPDAWHAQAQAWELPAATNWLVSGVEPTCRAELIEWLRARGSFVRTLDSFRQLPLQVDVETPEQVGIDRLLNAVAANVRRSPSFGAALVDAGSAVTVDYVDTGGVFRGGAIFPGLRLMSQALHDYTAKLPLVEIGETWETPGRSTENAIRLGIVSAVLGAIERLNFDYEMRSDVSAEFFVTGGDGPLLSRHMSRGFLWPEMTLEGLLHSFNHSSADA